jgi:uncharacterized RDD family membrane protein YckC
MADPAENDTTFRAETPEGIEYTLYPAGLCARFCAYSLDTIAQWVLLTAFIIIYYAAMDAAAGIWLIFLVRFAVDWFYHVICELFFRGQTPGKRLLGLRVVQDDGSPVGAAASFLRNLLRFVDGYTGLFLIAFLCAAVSRGFRRPGDWAAGTLVIYTWESQTLRRDRDMLWLAAVPPALPGRALSYEEKQGILMFARRYPLLGPARADEIAAPLAASLRGSFSGNGAVGNGAAGNGASAWLLGIARSFAGTAEHPGETA